MFQRRLQVPVCSNQRVGKGRIRQVNWAEFNVLATGAEGEQVCKNETHNRWQAGGSLWGRESVCRYARNQPKVTLFFLPKNNSRRNRRTVVAWGQVTKDYKV